MRNRAALIRYAFWTKHTPDVGRYFTRSTSLKVYHLLPPAAKNFIASRRGYALRALRYGRETDSLIREAIERESWSDERWSAWQSSRLREFLWHAVTHVPYYRESWRRRRLAGDNSSWENLKNWPILEKETLRNHARAFIAAGSNTRLVEEHTSGSTGKPLQLWISRNAIRHWYALAEARWRIWYGVSRCDNWAIFGGQLVVSIRQSQPPFWVWNKGLSQLYCSSYHLKPAFLSAYVEALEQHRIVYLYGYTSALNTFAQLILESGGRAAARVRELGLRVVLVNAEPVYKTQKKNIAEAFGCSVFETYGMSEMVAGASECSAGSLHLWPEVGILEISTGDTPATPDDCGDVICTGLLNEAMPLVRYRVGDRASPVVVGSHCDCGRTLPRLSGIEGRIDDTLCTADGRRIGRLDPVFKAEFPIREAQIIQETINRVVVRMVPASGFTEAVSRAIAMRIRDRMGPIEVAFDYVDHIPRGPNGKFRAQICRVSKEQSRHLEQRTTMHQSET